MGSSSSPWRAIRISNSERTHLVGPARMLSSEVIEHHRKKIQDFIVILGD